MGFPIETTVLFIVIAVAAIGVDMYAHRKDSVVTLKSASLWSLFWVAVSLLFGVYLGIHHDTNTASLFFTGYALEKVLSVDNLFVIMAIFQWFKVPEQYRHRVLHYGILGAIVFRLIFVAIGTGLLSLGAWVEVVFGAFVLWSAWVMLKQQNEDEAEEDEDYSQHLAYRWVHKFFPVTKQLHGHDFFVKRDVVVHENGDKVDGVFDESTNDNLKKATWAATPLLLCLAVIELSDVMFAFDSVPAVIAVSKEPLIVYSAMMFAILGLRSMYFVLEALKGMLVYLEKAVIILLFFIGFKLILSATNHMWHHGWDISPVASLVVVLLVLTGGIVASLIWKPKEETDKINE